MTLRSVHLVNIVTTLDAAIAKTQKAPLDCYERDQLVDNIYADLVKICPPENVKTISDVDANGLHIALKCCAIPYVYKDDRVIFSRDYISKDNLHIAQNNVEFLLKSVAKYKEIQGTDEHFAFLRTLSVLLDGAVGSFYDHYDQDVGFRYSIADLNALLYHYGLDYRIYKIYANMYVKKVNWGVSVH